MHIIEYNLAVILGGENIRKINRINLVFIIRLVILTLCCTWFLGGCGKKQEDKRIRIGVSISNLEDNFLSKVKEGMEEYQSSLGEEIEVMYFDAKVDVEKQIEQVRYFIQEGVDAIIVLPVDTRIGSESADRMTELARKAKIPIVHYAARDPEEKIHRDVYYVNLESKKIGMMQMEYLAEKLDGKGSVGILMGELNNRAAFERTEGVEGAEDKYPDIKIVVKESAKWLRPLAASVVETWLDSGKELDAIAANNDEMAIGAIGALEKHGKLGEVMVMGIDATDEAMEELIAGKMTATIFQPSYGQGKILLDTAFKVAKGEKVENEIWIPFELVTQENYNEFINQEE